MKWHPRGYGGERRSPDRVKREGWREQGVLRSRSTTSASPGPSGSWSASSARSSTASARRPAMD